MLCIAIFLQVGASAMAVLLVIHSHVELICVGPPLTHLCIALLAVRFLALLNSPTQFTLRGLCVRAAIATMATVISMLLLFCNVLGWLAHDVALQCVVCMVVLSMRPACLTWAYLKSRRFALRKTSSATEQQFRGA